MAATAPTTSDESPAGREGFLHFIAREGRVVLRWTIGACLVATVVCMVSPLWMTAIIPALLLMVAYILLVLTNEVERRSDKQSHRILEESETAMVSDVTDDHAEDHQLQPMHAEIVKRESRTGIYILAAVMLTALLIASIVLDFEVVAIGALVVFAYILLIAAPLWLGWFNDDIEDETQRLENEPPSAPARTTSE